MLQPSRDGGAGLTAAELREASQPDNGGHTPADIWRSVGGDEAWAKRLDDALQYNKAPKDV